jgi:hypothetical protein
VDIDVVQLTVCLDATLEFNPQTALAHRKEERKKNEK